MRLRLFRIFYAPLFLISIMVFSSGLLTNFAPLQQASQVLAATSQLPLLHLPWVAGKQYNINGGYTYGCGDHKGRDAYAIDFNLPLDSPVAAVAAGIAHLGFDPKGYGNYIWIAHPNNFVSLYGHLDSFVASEGQSVSQGQLIGYSGSTGNSTGPHLHFSLRSGATTQSDGKAALPEPMSGYTGFGHYGISQDSHCKTNNPSPMYFSSQWSPTGNILLSRYSFQATTLNNGKVLIEGGFAPGLYTTDSELFDPTTGVWTQTGSLNQGRGEHSATLLQDGRVLVAGGYAGPVLNSAEIYDPATGTWTLTGSMSQVRTRHTATLLQNGKVLVAGGWNGDVISGAELYDPSTGSWSSAGNMLIPRAGQVAVLLQNGQVLVAGGATLNNQLTTESELYDPNTNTWTQTGSLNVLTGGTGVLLPNGKVLMAGDGTSAAELYDPTTGTWTVTGSMQHARSAGLGMQALLLADGTVLIAGGDTAGTSEVYYPSSGTWGVLKNMVAPQCGGATALLPATALFPDGRALIAGGTDCVSPDNKLVATEFYL